MKMIWSKLTVTFIALIAFLFVAFMMPTLMVGMEHHGGMPMQNCPFMVGEEVMCSMSVLEHIASWQAMMTAVPPEILVLVFLIVFVAIVSLRHLFDPPDLFPPHSNTPFRFSRTSLFSTLLLGSVISPRAP